MTTSPILGKLSGCHSKSKVCHSRNADCAAVGQSLHRADPAGDDRAIRRAGHFRVVSSLHKLVQHRRAGGRQRVPKTVCSMSSQSIDPFDAMQKPTIVVMMTSRFIRGLVNS